MQRLSYRLWWAHSCFKLPQLLQGIRRIRKPSIKAQYCTTWKAVTPHPQHLPTVEPSAQWLLTTTENQEYTKPSEAHNPRRKLISSKKLKKGDRRLRSVISMESIFPASLHKAMLTQKWCWKRGTQEKLLWGEGLFPYVWLDMAIASNKIVLHLACPQIHLLYWAPKHRMGEPNSLQDEIPTGMVPKPWSPTS